ncbi:MULTISPECIES: hypothetical protein [unclassified Rhizobium]|uniref:hypothetical protein n=1 Tax=unclassified Rhizobium TaxID=2613769 RepID=UPI00160E7F4B|nr:MULTISPECIES: hypothetical protein [unclassified Rhizobium]MBB3318853.1 hypothetical protein [Rhizobium sp. BK181]MCS4096701.1 hypothetical protein [Rhizobium sp. BK176]
MAEIRSAKVTATTGVPYLAESPLDLLVGICLFHSITISENEERKGDPTFEGSVDVHP